jgi:hypothetical protein
MPIIGRHDVYPCFKWTFFLDGKIGGHHTARFDASDQKMSLCEFLLGWPSSVSATVRPSAFAVPVSAGCIGGD